MLPLVICCLPLELLVQRRCTYSGSLGLPVCSALFLHAEVVRLDVCINLVLYNTTLLGERTFCTKRGAARPEQRTSGRERCWWCLYPQLKASPSSSFSLPKRGPPKGMTGCILRGCRPPERGGQREKGPQEEVPGLAQQVNNSPEANRKQ